MIVCREILRRNEIAAVERVTGRGIGEGVVLATRLRARSAVGRALTDHAGHETLSGVRDAQRPVNECFETELRYRLADRANVLERVLARQHHALDAEALHDAGAARIMDGHLRRTVHLQLRIHLLDEPDGAQILYDRRIYSTVDTFAQVGKRFRQFLGLDEHVEREVHAGATGMRNRTGLGELVQRELSTLIAGVVHRGAEIHRIGAIGDRGTNGVESAGWREEFRNGGTGHPQNIITTASE